MQDSDLVNLMLSGSEQTGFEGQIFHLIEEAPISLVVDAVHQIAENNNSQAKLIFKNLNKIASRIGSARKFED
jgi:hypothetical protein